MFAATVVDIRTRRIPNELTAAMAGIGVGLSAAGVSGISVWASMLGFVIGLALMMPGHVLGATGAGDVKLMAMVGAFVGPWPAVLSVLWSCVAGGVLALAYLMWTGNTRRGFGNVKTLVTSNFMTMSIGHVDLSVSPLASAGKLPYGVAIASGTIAFLVVRQLGFIH